MKRRIVLIISLVTLVTFSSFISTDTISKGSYKSVFSDVSITNDEEVVYVWGIDISHHQNNINWNAMNKRKPHFIFLKATEGTTHKDTKYKEYKKKAESLDIITGAYHFFSYSSNGYDQAIEFIKFSKLQKGNLPYVLDAEYRGTMPSNAKVTKELISFIRTIQTKTGQNPIIYCDYDYYIQYLKGKLKGSYPLWICDYRREPKCNYKFWQKTDKYQHPSCKSRLDFNLFNGNLAQLKALQMK